jgi:hypothetical protein
MPLQERGQKTLWIYTGVFLFLCLLVIMAPLDALPLMLCMPALFSVMSERQARPAIAAVVTLIPALLVFLPEFRGSAIMYLFLMGCGVIFHRQLSRGNISTAVLLPSCLLLALAFSSIMYLAGQQGVSFGALISRWVGGFMDQMMAVYKETSTQSAIDEMAAFRASVEGYAVQLFWGFLASSILSIMWVNLLIANRVNWRYHLDQWRCPDWVVGAFILAGVLSLLEYDQAHLFGINLLVVVLQVYFFQGIAIVASAMMFYDWSRFVRYIVYILILTQIYMMIGIAGLGLFDTWFDFRKKIRTTEGDKT